MQSFGGCGHLVQQDRGCLEVPVGISGVGMAEIGGQREQVPAGLCPAAGHSGLQGTRREAVTKVMQARAGLARAPTQADLARESDKGMG